MNKLRQTSTSTATKCHRIFKQTKKLLLRVYDPQRGLSRTFHVLAPGLWHLNRIHVSQISNSYFSTSANNFWFQELLDVLSSPNPLASIHFHSQQPALTSTLSFIPNSAIKLEHVKLVLKNSEGKSCTYNRRSLTNLCDACGVSLFSLNNVIGCWCLYENVTSRQGQAFFTPVKSMHTFCNSQSVKSAGFNGCTYVAPWSVLTPPALTQQSNSHTQSTAAISDITLYLDENYRPVLQLNCWVKHSLHFLLLYCGREETQRVYWGSAVPRVLPACSTKWRIQYLH